MHRKSPNTPQNTSPTPTSQTPPPTNLVGASRVLAAEAALVGGRPALRVRVHGLALHLTWGEFSEDQKKRLQQLFQMRTLLETTSSSSDAAPPKRHESQVMRCGCPCRLENDHIPKTCCPGYGPSCWS